MSGEIINGIGGWKRMQWLMPFALFFFLLAPSEATAYDGPYDRSFYVNEEYDMPDGNTLDGVADADLMEPGIQCTLRAALMEAQAQGGTTLITLGSGTYENTIGQQFINANVIIEGQGSDSTRIEGNHIARVISVGDVYDHTNYAVIIIGVTLQNGTMSDDRFWGGGGIRNYWSTVNLKDVVIKGCAAGGASQCIYGGGIYNASHIALENCTITENYANGEGGGIYNHGSMVITNSTISDNVAGNGAGLDNHSGTITITGSTFSGNRASGNGGGIKNESGSSITDITNSTISGNTAGVRGGGIYDYYGGGTLTNVTLAYNKAPGSGGGGIYQSRGSPYPSATLKNTIIARNLGGNCAGTLSNIKDNGGNLSFGGGCGLREGDPLLGPLQDNGGPTFTHALLRGSAAIDAALTGPSTDQRGVGRPQDGDGDAVAAPDIGAFECEGIPPLPYPAISLSPGSLDFGEVDAGQSSAPAEIAVSNAGPINLVVSGMSLSDTTNYSLDVNGGSSPCGRTTPTIQPGRECTVAITFTPSSGGAFNATLTISSNDPDQPSLNVPLTGNGVLPLPDISVSPPSLDFGEVMVGYSSDQTVTVTNEGAVDLTVGAIGSGDPLAEPFSIATDGCSGQTISPAGSCELTVRFRPTTEGEFTDSFDIRSDDPGEGPITVDVTGVGIPRRLAAELWQDIHDGGNGDDYFRGVAIDSQGNVIAVGFVKGLNEPEHHSDAYIKKYMADGSDPLIDVLDMGEAAFPKMSSEDYFLDVAVDSEDNIVVAGLISGTITPPHDPSSEYQSAMFVRKYSPSLTALWERTYWQWAYAVAYGVDIGKDDNVYAAGGVWMGDGVAYQWAILNYDKDGNPQSGFPLTWDYTSANSDLAYDIAVDEDGNFIAVGYRRVADGNDDWQVRKYDSSRNLVWDDTYDGNGLNDYAWGVDVDSSGDVFVVGYTEKVSGNYDWLIIKYAKDTGDRLWTRTFESAEGRSEQCFDVVVDGLDNVLVGGGQRGADDIVHWRLERLNGEDGSVLAEQVWESDNDQILYGLAFRNRRIALCGAEHNGTDWDMRAALGEPPPLEVAEVAKGEGETITLDWSWAMGQVTIEYSPTLSPPDWQPITVPMSETSCTVEIPPDAPSGYYRLVEE